MVHVQQGQGESGSAAGPAEYVGQVTYIFAYDVAYEMARKPVETLLGEPARQFEVAASPRLPREMFFYRPQMVSLPDVRRAGPGGAVTVRRTVKLFPVGAISIAIHVPFRVRRVEDLAAYHDLELDGRPLQQEARALANEVVADLGGLLVRPVAPVRDEEAYTVFCLDAEALSAGQADFSAEAWLAANRRAVAGLLNDDRAELLSDSETADTVSHHLTYRRADLVVMDWDSAVVIEARGSLEEVLHVMELANVQLAELEAYDRTLDDVLERSYRDLARQPGRTWAVLRGLREIRLDLSRLSDELSNTAKFFGDWHLARVYQRLFVLFHLGDWQRAIDEKLRTLGELYQMLRQDQTNRWMIILEASIVLLFIIDLVVLLWGLAK